MTDGATGLASEAAVSPPPFQLSVQFTGSGSEYFRIWIVNLLLTLVTLGFYYPWAKVRRLRYFHGNTLVGGEPLDFHANPRRMLKGYLLSGFLFGAYTLAGYVSPWLAFAVFLVLVAVGPLLFRSAMRFRMSNTSWRALRFGFNGTDSQAYRALLPLLLPGLLMLAGVAALASAAEHEETVVSLGIGLLVVTVLSALAMPWLLWRVVRYQRNHLTFAGQVSRFFLKSRGLYAVGLKALGLLLLGSVLVGVLGLVFFNTAQAGEPVSLPWMALLPLGMLLFFVVWTAYVQAHLQNVLWNHTRTEAVQVHSALGVGALARLSIKNWLLMLLTLGFYWPFAVVATARLRLEAVAVFSDINPDQLVQSAQAREASAVGDAASDWFDIDIGF